MPSPPLTPYLSTARCEAYLQDPNSRLRKLWGDEVWKLRRGSKACWDNAGGAEEFFSHVARGSSCDRNWYEGSPGQLGQWGPTDDDGPVIFTASAPALLGFDDSIDMYVDNMDGGGGGHAAASVRHNANILQLFPPAEYSICVNYQWLVCAAKGRLHGQASSAMRFAYPPGRLSVVHAVDGGPSPRDYSSGSLGPDGTGLPTLDPPRCVGQAGCLGWEAHQVLGSSDSYSGEDCYSTDECYWSGDIFHLEACLLSAICENGDEIFQLEVGELWHCHVTDARLTRLQGWLVS